MSYREDEARRILKEVDMAYGVGTDYGRGEMMDPPEHYEKTEREFDENLFHEIDEDSDDYEQSEDDDE
jgi:hypothetical protein